MPDSIEAFLDANGLSSSRTDLPATSTKTFPDGASYRVEIPSTEGPDCLRALLDEAATRGVQIHRISQGSGVIMLTDEELAEMARIGFENTVEVSLFVRSAGGWTANPGTTFGSTGLFSAAYGQSQLEECMQTMVRAAEAGIRSVLISDIGVLSMFGKMKKAGLLPEDMQAKISVMLTAANAASAVVLEELGASTLNLPVELSLDEMAKIRQAIDIPIDIYVESPGNLGGHVRLHEIPEMVRVLAPVYLKFGVRNGPDIYPSGMHLQQNAEAMVRERVRRAQIGLEILERSGLEAQTSELGAEGLAVPKPEQPVISTRG